MSTKDESNAYEHAASNAGPWVFLFFACFLLLFCSGRLASGDANYQLRSAILLARTGTLGSPTQVDKDAWVPSPNGYYYEPHDIGNSLLMFPSAYIALLADHRPLENVIEKPPLIAKIGISLTYALFSAIGCCCMYALFSLYNTRRIAFLMSLAFVVTTPYWAISRSAWDVLGSANGMAIFMWAVTKVWLARKPAAKDIVWMLLGFAIAASFRSSLLPFLGAAIAMILWLRRKSLTLQSLVPGGIAFCLAIAPGLYYNYVRMGSPFKPAVAAPQFINSGMNSFTGHYLDGLYGLYLSPNWGLLCFSPVFVLLLAVPFIYGKLDAKLRALAVILAVAAAGYSVVFSSLMNWNGQMGWGSRYMVPPLPIFYFILSIMFPYLWKAHRGILIFFVALSFVLQVPSAFINWQQSSMDMTDLPPKDQTRARFAPLPRQQIAAWKGFLGGLAGKELPGPPSWDTDPNVRSLLQFPDLFLARIMRHSKAGAVGGSAALLLLLGLIIYSLRQILGYDSPADPPPLHAADVAVSD
jgi:hypothetical protein